MGAAAESRCVTRLLLPRTVTARHGERSEAIQGRITTPWMASLRSP
jgi:hypothetical protein